MKKGPCHEALKPLLWLMGRWKTVRAGEGSYPTMKPFRYCDELVFESLGQPLLNYMSTTWHPTKRNPIHLERGFLRIKPDTDQIAFVVAHNLGVSTLEEGIASENEVKCKTLHVSSMSFVRDPKVVALERRFRLNEAGHLEITLCMETVKTPLTLHLKAEYEKI